MQTDVRASEPVLRDGMCGTLQVDVDDLWVYYESIGLDTPPGTPPLAFTEGIPRLLDLFDRFRVRGTFFVCGRDLGPGCAEQRHAVAEIVRRGHEVANHSQAHRNGYARLSLPDLRADIAQAGDLIAAVTGVRPVGFKAPGFSYNPGLPQVLSELGYLYDSSLLPTWFAPLIRLVQRRLSGGRVDPTHYGRAVYGLAPLRPYQPQPGRPYRSRPPGRRAGGTAEPAAASAPGEPATIWEAPVSTIPIVRVPMHSTFVLSAGQWLFDLGWRLARARRLPINYLLHAADVLDATPDPALASYRFLAATWAAKRPAYEHILGCLSASHRLAPTAEFVAAVAGRSARPGSGGE